MYRAGRNEMTLTGILIGTAALVLIAVVLVMILVSIGAEISELEDENDR
jgi:hypothetical protein